MVVLRKNFDFIFDVCYGDSDFPKRIIMEGIDIVYIEGLYILTLELSYYQIKLKL